MNIISTQSIQTPKAFSAGAFKNPSSSVKTSIFYFNDIHGQIPKMQRLYSASENAKLSAAQNGADFFKFLARV